MEIKKGASVSAFLRWKMVFRATFDILLSVNGEDSYGGCAMNCVLFGGFLGRAPYSAARISASVTFRIALREVFWT